MDIGLIVERTLDTGEVLKVLTNKEIFDAISEDDSSYDDLSPDVLKEYWLRVVDGSVLIGVVNFKPTTKKCYEGHIHILPQFRKASSLIAGDGIVNWLNKNMKGVTVHTKTPACYPNVQGFLKKFDFESTGRMKSSWLKGGELHDLIIMSRSF